MPHRVLADGDDGLHLAYWPGITSLAPTSWIASRATDAEANRRRGLDELASGRWALGPHRWTETALRSTFLEGEHFSVHRFQHAASGRPIRWYVNFELPFRRTPSGIDTMDLAVDLVVDPDLAAHRWKDEDEYAQVRRLGVVDDHLHAQVELARGRALGILQDRVGPFAEPWQPWAPDPSWPTPVLPEGADRV